MKNITTGMDLGDKKHFICVLDSDTLEEGIPKFVKWYREYYRV